MRLEGTLLFGACLLSGNWHDHAECTFFAAQLISQIVNARVAIVRLGEFLAADVQPELPLVPAAPHGAFILNLHVRKLRFQIPQDSSRLDLCSPGRWVPVGCLP